MNYQDMALFVRKQADTDADDAPDETLRVYARAAYDDIRRRVFPWPDKKSSYQFQTVPGQSFYGYVNMTAPDLDFVLSVHADNGLLGYVTPEQYLEVSATGNTGVPTVYSADVAGMHLYPAPSAAQTIKVTGYRKFVDWPLSNADEPDLDRAFDTVICWYMLSGYYGAQEDLELAQLYSASYERALNTQIEAQLRSSSATAGPKIFGNQSLGFTAMRPAPQGWLI